MVAPAVVHRDPILEPRIFSKKINRAPCFPLGEKNAVLFAYARVALFEGLKVMGIGEGDTILVPHYVCNVVLAPMHIMNITVRFYDVDDNLKPVWDSVQRQLDSRTKALLMVNYFGFPNELHAAKNFCDANGIYLIEDNAHSFLSIDEGKPLGTTGDISIFSFRKMVPVSNGAVLLVNNKRMVNRLSMPGYLRRGNNDWRYILKAFSTKIENSFCCLCGHKKNMIDYERSRLKDSVEEYNLEKYFIPFSALSTFLLRRFDLEHIRAERRSAYTQWLDFFSHKKESGIKPVFPHLEPGVVPYCFPVFAEHRKEFISRMWQEGLESFPWPFLPRDSKENHLSTRMVCLPVSGFDDLSTYVK